MSEISGGAASAGAEGAPDAAAGGMPAESDLPGLQGLDQDADESDRDRVLAGEAAPGALADPEADTTSADSASGSSDPMPDMSGTDTT